MVIFIWVYYKLDSWKVESKNNFKVLNLGVWGSPNALAYISESFKFYDVCFHIVLLSSSINLNNPIGKLITIENYNYDFSSIDYNLEGLEIYFISDNPNTPTEGRGRLAIKIPRAFQRISLITHLSMYSNYDYQTPILSNPEYVNNLPSHKFTVIK